jgi:hypothetical protein
LISEEVAVNFSPDIRIAQRFREDPDIFLDFAFSATSVEASHARWFFEGCTMGYLLGNNYDGRSFPARSRAPQSAPATRSRHMASSPREVSNYLHDTAPGFEHHHRMDCSTDLLMIAVEQRPLTKRSTIMQTAACC